MKHIDKWIIIWSKARMSHYHQEYANTFGYLYRVISHHNLCLLYAFYMIKNLY